MASAKKYKREIEIMREGEVNMREIDTLRNKLHESIERGNTEEMLMISQELDVKIVKFMKKDFLSL